MTGFTVYLFVRGGDRVPTASAERRLQALGALREELLRAGVRVTPMPGHADLDVEITNVFGSGEHTDGHRVIIVRLSVGDDRLDFVCSDGIGRVSAEHHAAKRIVVWLESLLQGDFAQHTLTRALCAHLSSES